MFAFPAFGSAVSTETSFDIGLPSVSTSESLQDVLVRGQELGWAVALDPDALKLSWNAFTAEATGEHESVRARLDVSAAHFLVQLPDQSYEVKSPQWGAHIGVIFNAHPNGVAMQLSLDARGEFGGVRSDLAPNKVWTGALTGVFSW